MNKILLFFFLLIGFFSHSQNSIRPIKIGILYNYGTNENFIFNDEDYTYASYTLKGQLFYALTDWKGIKFEMAVQPQIQFLEHQLINEQFVTPDQSDYIEKRAEFTKQKNFNLYGLEFGFIAKKELSKLLSIQGSISLGFSYIDKRTERLAQGFTFIENFSLGFAHKIFEKSFLYIGTNFGHVSNLNFQKPNDGYNILGLEIGYQFEL